MLLKEKIENQWETEENIYLLSSYLNEKYDKKLDGVCHGTRTEKNKSGLINF